MDFPDYEAAAKAMWLMSSALSARWVSLSSAFKERLVAKATVAVDAALGDEPLYREATAAEWATGKIFCQDMPIMHVWPEVSDDS